MMALHAIHQAIRHGVYSAMTVLPGEDRAEFQKLFRQLIDEYAPNGVSEFELVLNLARLFWRQRNLATYRLDGVTGQPGLRLRFGRGLRSRPSN
jgi:hypothetical protein